MKRKTPKIQRRGQKKALGIEERKREETEILRKVHERGRRDREAGERSSFSATGRLGVQTRHGQHTKHWTQSSDPDSCH